MAVRRMFSREICETDDFLDLPATAQRLYFFLGLQADDEGFLQNANSVMRLVGSSRDDMNVLAAKRFVIPFDSGVVVLRHWRQHNYVPKDRFHPTRCLNEKALLFSDATGAYDLSASPVHNLDTICIHAVHDPYPEGREGERRLNTDAPSVVADAPPAKKTSRFVPPSVEEVAAYCTERSNGIDPQEFVDHYAVTGWMRRKTPIKDWRACVRTWEKNRRQTPAPATGGANGFDGYESF